MDNESINKLLIIILIILTYMYFTKQNCKEIIETFPIIQDSPDRRDTINSIIVNNSDNDKEDENNNIIDNPPNAIVSSNMLSCIKNIEMNACELSKKKREAQKAAKEAALASANEKRAAEAKARAAANAAQKAEAKARAVEIKRNKDILKQQANASSKLRRSHHNLCPMNPKDRRGNGLLVIPKKIRIAHQHINMVGLQKKGGPLKWIVYVQNLGY